MHKNPHQNAGNGIKETLFFKIFHGSMSPDPPPLEVLAPSVRVGQIRVHPLKISKPDAYADENIAKIWIKIPYLGNRGENIIKSCTSKIQRFLAKPVKFIIIYDTKRISFFVSNKDKLPLLSGSNLVYEVSCPGCGKSYIGMTKRCLSVCLKEHATQITISAIYR